MKAVVTWAGDGTTQQPETTVEGHAVKVQMFWRAPPGPHGGRPALVVAVDAAGRRVEDHLFAEVFQIRREFDPVDRDSR